MTDEKRLPAPTLLDRVVGYFDPVKGARRYQARLTMHAASSWVAASRTRSQLRTWNPALRDADADTLHELGAIRTRSRDAVRNVPMGRGAILTNTTSVVGAGLRMRPSIDADALGLEREDVEEAERAARRGWQLWSRSPYSDAAAKLAFMDQQGLAWRSFLENGDVFALTPTRSRASWPFRLAVQLIEADRVSNPGGAAGTISTETGGTIANGIERTKAGEVVAAHIAPGHPGSLRRSAVASDWRRVPFRGQATGRVNLIHLHDPERINESRGVPYLAPVIETLKQLGRFTEAELAAAVISSMFTVFVETENGIGLGSPGAAHAPGVGEAPSGQPQYEMGVGAMVELAAGQKTSFADPTRPNDSFDPFFMAIVKQLGVALEIPAELLLKHFSTSYTASRAAMQEAWRHFLAKREFFARVFCQPIYDLLFEEMVLLGMVPAPGFLRDPMVRHAYTGAQWIGPPRGQINEKVETASAVERMNANLSTLAEETAAISGGDWERNLQQRAIEKETEQRAGLTPASSVPADDGDDDTDVDAPENDDGEPQAPPGEDDDDTTSSEGDEQ